MFCRKHEFYLTHEKSGVVANPPPGPDLAMIRKETTGIKMLHKSI